VPLSEPLRALWGADALCVPHAGDDYQIAFTALPGPAALSQIGRVEARAGVSLTHNGNENSRPNPGYRHF